MILKFLVFFRKFFTNRHLRNSNLKNNSLFYLFLAHAQIKKKFDPRIGFYGKFPIRTYKEKNFHVNVSFLQQ